MRDRISQAYATAEALTVAIRFHQQMIQRELSMLNNLIGDKHELQGRPRLAMQSTSDGGQPAEVLPLLPD